MFLTLIDARTNVEIIRMETSKEAECRAELLAYATSIGIPADNQQIVSAESIDTTERDAAYVRAKRDARLAACDWTQLPDSPLSTEAKANWATYRQALRDVPAQTGFPGSVEWPTEPAAE